MLYKIYSPIFLLINRTNLDFSEKHANKLPGLFLTAMACNFCLNLLFFQINLFSSYYICSLYRYGNQLEGLCLSGELTFYIHIYDGS